MRFREIIDVWSENYRKQILIFCGENVEFLNVKAGGTSTYRSILNGKKIL
jgi:hypothetical protein